MPCKGVFFDWFNTLAGYETPRELLYQQAFRQCGIELTTRTIYKGIQRGDRYYFSKGAPLLTTANTLEARARYYYLYPQFILDEAQLDVLADIQLTILQKVLSEFSAKLVLFPDSVSTLQRLKASKMTVGVITNADARIVKMIQDSGLGALVDQVTTSDEARCEKPAAGIFNLALRKAALRPANALFVGDQYHNDVVGACGVGMKAILIDRYDAQPDADGYIRVRSLDEVIKHIG